MVCTTRLLLIVSQKWKSMTLMPSKRFSTTFQKRRGSDYIYIYITPIEGGGGGPSLWLVLPLCGAVVVLVVVEVGPTVASCCRTILSEKKSVQS